jgi:hypothetical protein
MKTPAKGVALASSPTLSSTTLEIAFYSQKHLRALQTQIAKSIERGGPRKRGSYYVKGDTKYPEKLEFVQLDGHKSPLKKKTRTRLLLFQAAG